LPQLDGVTVCAGQINTTAHIAYRKEIQIDRGTYLPTTTSFLFLHANVYTRTYTVLHDTCLLFSFTI